MNDGLSAEPDSELGASIIKRLCDCEANNSGRPWRAHNGETEHPVKLPGL